MKKFENEKFTGSLYLAINNEKIVKILITLKIQIFFYIYICENELNHHAPRKKKYIRGNTKPFMTKTLSKSIMERTRFRNRDLKNPTDENRLAFTTQKNFCVSLLRKEKLNEKNITHNRKFWQTVKLFLSEKNKSREKMLKNEEIIYDEVEVANTLNTFFANTVKNLKIPEKFADHYLPHSLSRHPTLNALLKYKDHPSVRIKNISKRVKNI